MTWETSWKSHPFHQFRRGTPALLSRGPPCAAVRQPCLTVVWQFDKATAAACNGLPGPVAVHLVRQHEIRQTLWDDNEIIYTLL